MKVELTPQTLALYLGCEVQTPNGKEKLICIDLEKAIGDCKLPVITITGDYQRRRNVYSMDEMKPILRRLSSLDRQEAIEFTKWLYGSMFGLPDEVKNIERTITDSPDSVGWIFEGLDKERGGITIEVDRGIELSLDSSKMKVNQFKCGNWLRAKGFDCDGLLDSQQAVEKQV